MFRKWKVPLRMEKKANIFPVFKKNNKQELKNYSPISFLPVSSKIFERLLYGSMFKFFTENNLISLNQSDFKPGDSCVNQLLLIKHQILKSPDNGHEARSVFLDMSKAFDKVWHKGLIFKLKQNGISGNLLSTVTDFLTLRKQRVVLNGQLSLWSNIESGVPQGSILGPLLFLIYINDLSEGLTTNAKLFADDVSLFYVVDNINLSATNLNSDFSKINAWANQWKMAFNPDPNKQTQEVIFSKIRRTSHPSLTFNNNSVKQVQFQKHLGVYFDSRLDFREHLQNMFHKINKTISLLRKLQNNLPRDPLITIYKSFIRSHLDCGDILHDQTFNNPFHERLESIQYNAALAIAGTIRGSSREILYQKLGFESLQQRRWYRKLCLFYKIIKNQSPKYLFELIPTARQAYMTRCKKSIPLLNVKHDYFKIFFFPSTIIEWNNLDSNKRNSENLALFKKRILAFIRPSTSSTFHCLNPNGLKLITTLRLGLSHLRFHKFKHSFQHTLNPICNCGTLETTIVNERHCTIL